MERINRINKKILTIGVIVAVAFGVGRSELAENDLTECLKDRERQVGRQLNEWQEFEVRRICLGGVSLDQFGD